MTRPGSINGETRKVAIASRPRKRPRTSATAHSVPSTREISVERLAICTEVMTEAASPRVAGSRSYQRNDQSGGGSVKTEDEPKETATVTTSGVIRNTTAKAAITQTATVAVRSMGVIRFSRHGGRRA